MENSTQGWTQSGSFQNQDTFFGFQKEQGKPLLSPVVARLLVWLNMHQFL